MHLILPRVEDFEVTGTGNAPQWDKAPWQPLARVNGPAPYATRAKTLYSRTGIYFLVDCEDRKLSCKPRQDFDDIYQDDVVEVFLWTDTRQPLYFEYELSPFNVELPIVVPNNDGAFHGWLPWHYTGARKVRRATSVRGGPRELGAAVEGWTAEFAIPFDLLRGLGNSTPTPGMQWRANIYRIDQDFKPASSHWAWCPDTGVGFHDYRKFGTFEFGV